jgi:hypothetical protein
MRTKWDILQEKLAKTEADLQAQKDYIRYLENTECVRDEGGEHISCDRCRTEFGTEADFAKHYLVPDERYPNLGNCPTRYTKPPPEEALDYNP